MSVVDDFAEIARRLREKQGLPKPKSVRNEPQQAGIQAADPGHSHSQQYQQAAQGLPWQNGQQAVQGMPPCSLCFDDGWIAVRRSGLWVGIQCIQCGNPRRKGCPAI